MVDLVVAIHTVVKGVSAIADKVVAEEEHPAVRYADRTGTPPSTATSGSKTDVSLFHYSASTSHVFLLVYVDDIIMMGDNSTLIDALLRRLSSTFKIRDLGTPNFFLGIEMLPVKEGLLLFQRRYMGDLLTRAGMSDCKPIATPASITHAVVPNVELFDNPTQYKRLAGALQYLTITLPDLSYVVNRLYQFLHAPTTEHWGLLKRVLGYVKGTLDYGLRLSVSASCDIHAFSDTD
ncbi:uncharacterized protein LOC116020185 [Ipomoea triloba]|uniref:uncharacterized protein LOC116020185 n=1 Tax=Ipomoea triloba TaxID=35885 RepID=UPI00125E583D|nr:uncharacterized protein LOC116020185 [Ipomoea triloba]